MKRRPSPTELAACLRANAPDPARASQALDRALPLELPTYRQRPTDSRAPTVRPKRGHP